MLSNHFLETGSLGLCGQTLHTDQWPPVGDNVVQPHIIVIYSIYEIPAE